MVSIFTRSAARIYGAMSVLGDGSLNVIESLMPFFEPILRGQQGNIFDPNEFASQVRDTYRWNFNTDVVEVFVPKMCNAGWLTSNDAEAEQTTYTITLPEYVVARETEATASRELRKLAEEFKAFSESLSPLQAVSLGVEQFEDILIEWLLYVEAFSEKNLEYQVKTEEDANGKLTQTYTFPRTTRLTDEERFLCARFVQYKINTDPKASEILSRIASIGLLTEVVQDFVKPNTPVETSTLVVYLDAPVAMELLGVSGLAARANTQPVVAELQRIGATVRVFGQSLEEIKHSLRSVLENPRPTGPTAQALARGEVLREFVAGVAENPERFLEGEGVRTTYRTLDQVPAETAYFTDDQRNDIYGALVFQKNLHARDHDADVTTLVMRLRHGKEDGDIFKARFVLMTKNGLLAQLVRRRCIELGVLSRSSVPPVVHRRVIATSMWLRTGLRADNFEVPKRMLLANCERVLAIRPGVVDAVKKCTDALGDEEKSRQLDLLISQHRSAQALMDKTLGAPGVVTAENISELFQEMLHPHLEEERERGAKAVEEEKVKGKDKVKKVRAELDAAIAAERATAEQLDTQLQEDKGVVEALCRDVERSLVAHRRTRKSLGLILAVLLCLPPAVGPSVWFTYLSVLVAIPLAYWTLTGSKLIGTTTSRDEAFSWLNAAASKRRLAAKVSRFDIDWRGEAFSVNEVDEPQEAAQSTTKLI